MLFGMFIVTCLAMAFNLVPHPKGINDIISFNLPSLKDTLFKLDIGAAWKFGIFHIIFTFTIVELFDNMGTLLGLTQKAKLMDEKGNIKNLDRALMTDSAGTMISSMVGTSTVTSYVESAAGIAEGGRTGLTALTVAFFFVISLFFSPLIKLVPAFATAPALIIVGALMMGEIKREYFDDITDAIPVFLTIIMMPLTYSIANGFAFGFISYTFIKVLSGKHREVSWIMWLLTIAFMVNFNLRLH